MIIVNPETKGPVGDSHLGEVAAGLIAVLGVSLFLFAG